MTTPFTPVASTLGGVLIGLAAAILLLGNGRIAGISGILGRLLPPYGEESHTAGAASFVIGLLLAPLIYAAIAGERVTQSVSSNLLLMGVAGLLVGIGTAYGNGCTSGHGVCGIARLSPRSLVATAIFMAFGFLTVFIVRHVLGS